VVVLLPPGLLLCSRWLRAPTPCAARPPAACAAPGRALQNQPAPVRAPVRNHRGRAGPQRPRPLKVMHQGAAVAEEVRGRTGGCPAARQLLPPLRASAACWQPTRTCTFASPSYLQAAAAAAALAFRALEFMIAILQRLYDDADTPLSQVGGVPQPAWMHAAADPPAGWPEGPCSAQCQQTGQPAAAATSPWQRQEWQVVTAAPSALPSSQQQPRRHHSALAGGAGGVPENAGTLPRLDRGQHLHRECPGPRQQQACSHLHDGAGSCMGLHGTPSRLDDPNATPP